MAARYSVAALTTWVRQLLESAGVPFEHAQDVARLVMRTESRGFVTHGITRIPTYIDKLQSGEYNPRPKMSFDAKQGVLRMDADGALGQLAALRAIETCIEMAGDTPSTLCFARNLGHLGAVGLYPLLAAERGLFALTIQRTAPLLALPGCEGPLVGHNPIAFASPVPNGDPIVFDMSCSVAARGHILLAAERNEPIPAGWALDSHGEPTTDAHAACDGMLLPAGDYKGLGIALLGETLAGCLAASLEDRPKLREAVRGPGAPGGGTAFFWVLNPALASDLSTFDTLVGDWTSNFLQNAGGVARMPGWRAAHAERNARQSGIEILEGESRRLRAVGERNGIPWPQPQER